MSTRTDVLQIRLETTGDGKVKASLAEVSAGIEKVDRSAGRHADADLARALGHRHQHDVHDPDASDDE